MDEELIVDESFVKKHQKDIIKVIPKTLSELGLYSPEDWKKLSLEQYTIYILAGQIRYLLILVGIVPQVLCDKNILKSPLQKVANKRRKANRSCSELSRGESLHS